jgi:hypothetical protein
LGFYQLAKNFQFVNSQFVNSGCKYLIFKINNTPSKTNL